MKQQLFGNHIEPSCQYCTHGRFTKDEKMILCLKNGIVAPYYSCRKFDYSPLKRIPRRTPALPSFSKEDFTL